MSSVFSPSRPAGASRWSALPREARDTVFVLAVVGWVATFTTFALIRRRIVHYL